jgi:uncharacterized membrane protein
VRRGPSSAISFQVIATAFYAGGSDVSADGSAVVTYSVGASGGGSIYRYAGGVSTPVASGFFIAAGGTSADGSVVVGGRSVGPGGPREAFRWQSGSLVPLGSGTGAALDISADASTIAATARAVRSSTRAAPRRISRISRAAIPARFRMGRQRRRRGGRGARLVDVG